MLSSIICFLRVIVYTAAIEDTYPDIKTASALLIFLFMDKFSLFVFQDVLSWTSQIRQIPQLPFSSILLLYV